MRFCAKYTDGFSTYRPVQESQTGSILAAQGGSPSAIAALLGKAVSVSPNDANAKYNLALVQSSQGNFKDAAREIENASFVKAQEKQPVPESVLQLELRLKQIVEHGAPAH